MNPNDLDARVLAAIRGGTGMTFGEIRRALDVSRDDLGPIIKRLADAKAITFDRDAGWIIAPPDLAALHAAWMACYPAERAAVVGALEFDRGEVAEWDDPAERADRLATLDAAIALLRAGA